MKYAVSVIGEPGENGYPVYIALHGGGHTTYWLRAPKEVRSGVVIVSYDRDTNTFHVEKNTAEGDVSIMVNDEMADLFSPITVTYEGESASCTVTPTLGYMKKTISEKWDRNMVFAAEIPLPSNK